jgi:hypothetical protein
LYPAILGIQLAVTLGNKVWFRKLEQASPYNGEPCTALDNPLVPVALDMPERPTLKMSVKWNYKAEDSESTRICEMSADQEEDEDEQMTVLPNLTQTIHLSNEIPIEQFRNDIRITFQLENLAAQIRPVGFSMVPRDGGDGGFFTAGYRSYKDSVRYEIYSLYAVVDVTCPFLAEGPHIIQIIAGIIPIINLTNIIPYMKQGSLRILSRK